LKYIKGPLIIFLVISLILIAIKLLTPTWRDFQQRRTSDSTLSSNVVRLAGDGYLGYWFMTSPDMKREASKAGLEIDWTDDGGAYAERLQNFSTGKYDAIVLPINSYLQHGAKYKFPGVIVAVISESKGADAIVGFGDILANGKINDLNNNNLKIAYTTESPSSFLLDLTIADFDLDALRTSKKWRVEAKSSEDVYDLAAKAVKNRGDSADAFVMWEPQVSKAIDKLGLTYIWGSDKFSGYIVDVFVFQREYVSRHSDRVKRFLMTYFSVLDRYLNTKDNRERMIKEMSKSTHLNEDAVKKMVSKIDWYDLMRNGSEQFGLQIKAGGVVKDGLVSSVIACGDILAKNDALDQSLIRDPYRIINSEILKDLLPTPTEETEQLQTEISASPLTVKPDFSSVNWSDLAGVGTMRVEPITFQRGRSDLDDYGKEAVDKIANSLTNNYPNYWVVVKGHTGPGDRKANEQLSQARAQTVMQRFIAVYGIDPHRLKAEGIGNREPPTRKANEDERSLELRMPRVEFVLMTKN
jgi:outer membrane protein OmpA-like peptidoglycan-associated protein/ABC-type nitrate/sulfonate/bicarbonate transport system substrate-binding protein